MFRSTNFQSLYATMTIERGSFFVVIPCNGFDWNSCWWRSEFVFHYKRHVSVLLPATASLFDSIRLFHFATTHSELFVTKRLEIENRTDTINQTNWNCCPACCVCIWLCPLFVYKTEWPNSSVISLCPAQWTNSQQPLAKLLVSLTKGCFFSTFTSFICSVCHFFSHLLFWFRFQLFTLFVCYFVFARNRNVCFSLSSSCQIVTAWCIWHRNLDFIAYWSSD